MGIFVEIFMGILYLHEHKVCAFGQCIHMYIRISTALLSEMT